MKAILLSIKPEWLVKILNKEKTIEVRKNKALANAIRELIKQYGKALIYMYCSNTVNKNLIYFFNNDINLDTTIGEWEEHYQILTNKELKNITLSEDKNNICRKLNGKVVARFWCDKVEDLIVSEDSCGDAILEVGWGLIEQTCLTEEQICRYIGKYNTGYAIHISKLEIFDEPKYLCDFWNTKKGVFCCPLTKAPQNYCYVEGE